MWHKIEYFMIYLRGAIHAIFYFKFPLLGKLHEWYCGLFHILFKTALYKIFGFRIEHAFRRSNGYL